MKFSVVIPLYNKAEHVVNALNSVLNQSDTDFEVIVVDDASTDEGVQRVLEIDHPKVKVIERSKPGPGGYLARNYGVTHSTGDWITFLDADDTWEPDHLANFRQLAIKYPDAKFLTSGYKLINETSVVEVSVGDDRVLSGCESIKLILWRDFIHTNTVCIDRDLYAAAGGFNVDRNWTRGGDSEFWFRLIGIAKLTAFSGKITSTWILDHSEITRKKIPIDKRHPVLEAIDVEIPRSMYCCKRIVRLYAWRKQLSWYLSMGYSGPVLFRVLLVLVSYPEIIFEAASRLLLRRKRS
ncbi:MAG: glycosyltransferase family 2 protein [Loktanella sp.]|nr:glycosyltransferase family 2 protein [Loktanella sp.]